MSFASCGSAAHSLMNSKAIKENTAEEEWDAAQDAWDACSCANRKCCSHAIAAKAAKVKLDEADADFKAASKGYADWCRLQYGRFD